MTIPHTRGFFIVAPSGAGKTHFITRQKEPHWVDGDMLWIKSGAQPTNDWWNQGEEIIKTVDARSDIVTQAAKEHGLWIMGASNHWLPPDAAVLPPWEINVSQIAHREQNNYDGGLKLDKLDQLKAHRDEIQARAELYSVPIFETVEEAAAHVFAQYQKGNASEL